jgi:S1-C subfamily serine protease
VKKGMREEGLDFALIALAMKISAMASLLILSGCTSFGDVIKVDEPTAARLRAEVKVYDAQSLSGLRYESVKSIHATSCTGRENATDQLRYIAESLGANGITKIQCNKLLGANISTNCFSSFICEALAITVPSDAAKAPIAAAMPAAAPVAQPVAPRAGGLGAAPVTEQMSKAILLHGTGFTLGKLPIVVTNYQAVGEAKDAEIVFPGQKAIKGRIVKRDEKNDLAIIAFDEFRAVPDGFQIFPTYKIKPGQDVYVIGYPSGTPVGENPGISRGTISATEGEKGDSGHFRITGVADPVNSQGPLLDAQGRVVGILSPALSRAYLPKVTGHVLEGTNVALKSTVLLNLYPEAEGLINNEISEPLSFQKLFEAARNSVVLVIIR